MSNSNFRLTKPSVIYRIYRDNQLGTISNNKMTDALAIEFLKVDAKRITLFSIFPENWKELVGVEPVKTVVVEPAQTPVQTPVKTVAVEPAQTPVQTPVKSNLNDLSFIELRKAYPNVSARSKSDFIKKVNEQNK